MRIAAQRFVVVCIVILSGCASPAQKPTQQAQPDPADQVFICSSTCTEADATRAIKRAFDQCTNTQNLYERRGFNSKGAQFAVSVVGALAGAVAAPIAKGTAAKAWSGLSGATNGIQANLNEDFSYQLTVQQRVAVSHAMTGNEVKIQMATTPFDKVIAAEVMKNECQQAAASAEAAFNQAIASAANIAAETNKQIVQTATAQAAAQQLKPTIQEPPASGGTVAPPPQPTNKPTTDGHHT